jgi:DMSO/TMAO reductase YedYZ molybdopterin-dependent catalytic subunit
VTVSRRDFLSTVGAAIPLNRLFRESEGIARQFVPHFAGQNSTAPPAGRFVRTMPLGRFDGLPASPLGRLVGAGLDARRFTDISTLTPDTLVTPTDAFFIRTAASAASTRPGAWTLALGGRVRRQLELAVDEIVRDAAPMGTHLMECSGNVDPANFGLISTARWTGVPLAALLDRIEPLPGVSLIRVTGLDDDTRPWQSSLAGASWIFARDELQRAGAFLATAMNDAPLTRDHGAPMRLVVPNWYGCACIKWVTSIDVVAADEPPTGQMREFAVRTHQDGVPAFAREFAPATIELAAMPIRVEKWSVDGRTRYRVIGVRWGGTSRTPALTIRFRHTEAFVPVEDSASPASTTTWALWSHTWRPARAGRYQIALGVGERGIAARRLEMFYYTREVEVDEV